LVYQVPRHGLPYAVYSVVDNRSGPKDGSRRLPLVEDPDWQSKYEGIVASKTAGAAMDVDDDPDAAEVFSGPRNPTPDLITARQQARGRAGGECDDHMPLTLRGRSPWSSMVS
jgi:hypothetical protein